MNNTIPWVEKYRPTNFNQIVLDDINYKLLNNIINTGIFPNLLFYGPPGTGKTTTIINLINEYHKKYNQNSKYLTIHLNASDERGIDIIRSQISQFVNSQSLFKEGMKVVILDEVDYMTKNAQQALKYLMQTHNKNIRFCLICNYISRIDETLCNNFLHMKFNHLPNDKIMSFLDNINKKEELYLNRNHLQSIQQLFKSDIRSMINYIQTNSLTLINYKIIDDDIWNNITFSIMKKENLSNILDNISIEYNIDMKNLIKKYIEYLISLGGKYIEHDFLTFSENLLHLNNPNIEYLKNYFVYKLIEFI